MCSCDDMKLTETCVCDLGQYYRSIQRFCLMITSTVIGTTYHKGEHFRILFCFRII